MNRLRYQLQIVSLIFVLLLAIDAFISVGTTCYDAGHHAGSEQNGVKYCSIFEGPFLGALGLFSGFVEKYREAVIPFFMVVLAVSTIGLWLATLRLLEAGDAQLRYMEETADARSADIQTSLAQARRSADTAANTLIADQRPWVSFKLVEPGDNLTYDASGARITLHCRLENTGRTPAQRVSLSVVSFTLKENSPQPVAAQEIQIQTVRTRQRDHHRFGHFLFPGQTTDQLITSHVPQAQIDELAASGRTNFFPTVIATIEYEFTFADGKHITSHIFEVRQAPNRLGPPIGQVIPREGLMIVQHFAGAYAD
jgi:hypothetical protein